MNRIFLLLFGAVCVLFSASCGGGGGGGGTGSTLASLSVISDFATATRTVPGYAGSLRVTVTPPVGVSLPGNFPNPFILTRSNTSREITGLTPSAQPYILDMEALTNNVVVGTAQRSIVVVAGKIREIDVSANLSSQIDSIVVEGPSNVMTGNNAQFTAYAKNASNQTLFSGAGFEWTSSNPSALSINSNSGLASAHLLGHVTVSATLKGTAESGSNEIDVESSGGVGITLSPPSASVLIGGQVQFSATVNGSSDPTVVWTVSPLGGSGSVNSSGLYTAPPSGGLYFLQATSVADPSAKAEALVAVNDPSAQQRFIYTSNFDGGVNNIFMIDATGDQFERLTNNSENTTFEDASDDGTFFIYRKQVASTNTLRRFDLSTRTSTLIPLPVSSFSKAILSPTETRVLLSAWDGSKTRVAVININGSGFQWLGDAGTDSWAIAWLPNESKVLFAASGSTRFWQMNLDGTNKAFWGTSNLHSTSDFGCFAANNTELLFPSDEPSTDPGEITRFDLLGNVLGYVDLTTFGGGTANLSRLNITDDGLSYAFQSGDSLWFNSMDGLHRFRIPSIVGASGNETAEYVVVPN